MSNGDERRTGELIGGKYRVVRFLAAGGMGVVYEAQHTVVKRRFAVKFLRPELAERRESLARFQREAQAAGALESENLTAAVDFGIAADGSPYIVMEYLVGENVEALLDRNGRLPLERATDLVHQACRGIQAAHAAGIVHQDLKPQNLFLCRREDGTDLLKVLDFGIAKLEAVRPRQRGHRDQSRAGHAGVHVARAGARREDHRPSRRRLRARRHLVRALVGTKAAPR
jgi:serine/threonine-protein kinase